MTYHDCLLTSFENAERVKQSMEKADEAVGVRPTITAFDLEAQDARSGDPGDWLDGRATYFENTPERILVDLG